MIKTKKGYYAYLAQDKRALNIEGTVKDWLTHDIWRFQRALRKLEYIKNCHRKRLLGIPFALQQLKVRRLGRNLGFSIPANVFGAGLSIAHAGTIVVNANTRVGENCRIHVCVNIGADVKDGNKAPNIGKNCYIGPGVKMFGGIILGDNVAIGANAVVNKSFESNMTIAGIPAKKISDTGPLEYRV